ncbi:YifB family Mg chelatase-like AAA ATPase [candidate division WWE3 bacterium]|uniref:YifB family Mg chelatase-like AAA ATPase n=1 Tax=candidate division WWE3 bacterium TaxID=2053526 RepID=A0A7X9HGE2_UNCKA|nr:YifB family Mg chelatase-like AAA ATPase [candidate division WWE3 bacterium]
MLKKIKSLAFYGLDILPVDVEVNISNAGIPGFEIVGLPNKSIEESKHRVKSAIQQCGFKFPNKKITVNLAPADINKEGSFYDLAIAVGILSVSENIEIQENELYYGELSLDGTIRHTRGTFNAALFALENGYNAVYISETDHKVCSGCPNLPVYCFKHLSDLLDHLKGIHIKVPRIYQEGTEKLYAENNVATLLFDDIVGHEKAKKMAAVLAAGGHHMLMIGSPGIGKTLLASALPSILPNLSFEESLEVTKVYSYTGLINYSDGIMTLPPVRTPHHSTTYVGMIGGGSVPRPGEITLAHLGVLFMDEFCEFPRQVIEVLRQPLELGYISLARARYNIEFPAKFTLLAASNPCKCGYQGDTARACTCTDRDIHNYLSKLSGPIMDRLDLLVRMTKIPDILLNKKSSTPEYTSGYLRSLVAQAREIQRFRYKNCGPIINRDLNLTLLPKYAAIRHPEALLLNKACDVYKLSPRSCHKIIRVARTLADMEGVEDISERHIMESIQYKCEGEL